MKGFFTILKMNIKILFRNPGYISFLFILPMTAVFLLNLNSENYTRGEEDRLGIVELEKADARIENMDGMTLNVKVYDFACSGLGEEFLESIVKIGNFQLYRYQFQDGEMLTEEQLRQSALKSMNESTISAVLVISRDFDALVQNGDIEESLRLFYGNEDSRINALNQSINQILNSMQLLSAASGGNQSTILEKLGQLRAAMPKIQTENIGDISAAALNTKQLGQMTNLKLSWAVITIAFLFSGVFISSVIITERNNGVLRRTSLSGAGLQGYGLVKCMLTVITVFIQIVVMGIGLKLFVKIDFGITSLQYLIITFGLALILNFLSVVIGILLNNLLSTSYAVFFISTIMTLVAGLFFPMEAGGWIGKFASLTPQKWAVRAAEGLLIGSEHVYGLYAVALVGFLVVILCVGLLGLNLIQREEY